ncbi:MAG: hypothetical protein ABR991_07660 [Terracidiphilus sp.]|jgi:hypothetical protein
MSVAFFLIDKKGKIRRKVEENVQNALKIEAGILKAYAPVEKSGDEYQSCSGK